MDLYTLYRKGTVKSLTSLWSCTARELAVRCCTSADRDITTVVARVKHEGLWFLAVTLADFGKSLERWLDQGFVVPSDVSSFARGSGGLSGLPTFLSGFLARVFDPCSGVLLTHPDIEAIYALRQLTLMFGKIALPMTASNGRQSPSSHRKVVSEERERRAMLEYVQCEQDVKAADARLDPQYLEDFKRVSSMLFDEMFARVDREVRYGELIAKHGPGAVADRLSSNAKWNQQTWPARAQLDFPDWHYLLPNRNYCGTLGDIHILEPGSETPVRVITVPKTLKTPRIIAIEPTAMQYMQQALYRAFLDSIQQDSFLRRVIGFDDQNPNRVMARLGSLSGDLATLDLSEASDRVSNEHVRAMLANYPVLLRAVDSCRSRKARVPGHGVLHLAKFASMGSALCFPMEAMVFLTVIFLGIERESSTLLHRDMVIRDFHDKVRVFGDDLIVPRDYVLSVVSELDVFGHRVNAGKSFWTGKFRESCGREYYDGEDVSIVRVRQNLPTSRQDAEGVIATVAFRNQAYWAGLWKTAAWLDDYLEKILKIWPNVAPTSPLLGRESALGYEFQTLDPNTHGPLTKGWFVRAESPRDPLDGSGALLKCLLLMEARKSGQPNGFNALPGVDEEHLERSGRPKHVSIKLGRRSPV